MTDKILSVFIKNQVPEFILEEHPKFVSFLEAYYEFLDNTSYGTAKDIRYIRDVDASIDDFEQNFFNMFLPFIPRDTPVNKAFVVKNILPLYLSKGSVKSYQFLFRLLFDQESEISYPGRSVLRASDGRWTKENVLRATDNVYSTYLGDGERTIYYLPQLFDVGQFFVFVDELLVSNYRFFRETQKIIFETAPGIGSEIKIVYTNFNADNIKNRKITGLNSLAYALVESTGKRKKQGFSYFELLINSKTLSGIFKNGELLYTDIIFNDNIIPLTLETFSDIDRINIIDGGSSYNIGDPVVIIGSAVRDAIAIIDDVASGAIDDLEIVDGGCGFTTGAQILADGYSTSFFNAQVTAIDSQGVFSSNSITYNTDVIGDYLNVAIDAIDYGFPAAGTENVNTTIANALSTNTITGLGGITSLTVLTSQISSTLSPEFDVTPLNLTANLTIRDLGVIGKIDIINGGQNYNAADYLIFTNTTGFFGQGANAQVRTVDDNGSITSIQINDGGLLYNKNYFPVVTVSSTTGSNAVLQVNSIMGDGDDLNPLLGNTVAGQILSIKILDSGVSYVAIPRIDLSGYGDGNALANATIRDTYIQKEGRWTTSDSIISTDDTVLQGKDYYIDFSYVISAKVEFYRYKEIVKNLLHPVGLVNYAKFKIEEEVNPNTVITTTSQNYKTLSGTINISNNSIVVVGTNTKFNVALDNGLLNVGSNIAIANQIRTVSSIQSNTVLEVNTAFTINANNQLITIS